MADRSVTAQIKLMFAAQSMGAIHNAMRNMVNSLNNVEEAIEKTNQAFGTLGDTGTAMIEVANGLLNPLQEASQAYVQRFGAMEATSARWIQSTMKLEQAQMKLGRAATQALQPLQDKLVTIIDKVADFVTQNPQILQLAAGVGGTLLAAGTAIAGISQAVAMINNLRSAIMALNATGGLAGGLGALGIAGAGLAMAPTLGMGAGKLIGQAIGGQYASEAVQGQEFGDVLESMAKTIVGAEALVGKGIFELYKAFVNGGRQFEDWIDGFIHQIGLETDEQFEANKASRKAKADQQIAAVEQNLIRNVGIVSDWADSISERIGGGGAPGGALGAGAGITQDMLDQYEQFLLEVSQAETQYTFQAEQQKKDHLRQMTQLDQDYNRQQRLAAEDYQRDRKQSADDFARQQAISARDFAIEQGRAHDEFNRDEMRRLKDFQLERQRAEEDHRRSITDAAARLDALAVIQEQRQFSVDQRRAKQDFDKETKLNQENFDRQQKLAQDNYDRQQKDAQENYDLQRRLAEQNYQIQRRRAEEEYNIQRQRAMSEFSAQQNMQRQQFEQERMLREQAYQKQIAQQLRLYTMTAEQSQAYYDSARVKFLAWIKGLSDTIPGATTPTKVPDTHGTNTPPGYESHYHQYALGGYSPGGLSLLHPREFVLSPTTTRAMEAKMGGPLTQRNVMGGLANLQLAVNNTFENVGSHSMDALEAMVKRGTRDALTEALRRYVGAS